MKTFACTVLPVHSTGLNIVTCLPLGVSDAYLTDDYGNFIRVADESLVAVSMVGCDCGH